MSTQWGDVVDSYFFDNCGNLVHNKCSLWMKIIKVAALQYVWEKFSISTAYI